MPYFYNLKDKVIKSNLDLNLTESLRHDDILFTINFLYKKPPLKSSSNNPIFVNNKIYFTLHNDLHFEINKNTINCYCKEEHMHKAKHSVLGLPFGFLMHQKNYFVLHASALSIGNKGVLFIGPSGSGKSSICAGLIQKGLNFISDDITIINNSLKLESCINSLDISKEILAINNKINILKKTDLNDDRDRISLLIENNLEHKVTISKIYFLNWSDKIEISKSQFISNFKKIFTNSFRSIDDGNFNMQRSDMKNILNISRNVECYNFFLKKDLYNYHQNIDYLIKHIQK